MTIGEYAIKSEVHQKLKIWGAANRTRNFCGWSYENWIYQTMKKYILIPLRSNEAPLSIQYKDIIDNVQLALDEYELIDKKGRECVFIIGLLYAEKWTPTQIERQCKVSRKTVYNLKKRIISWLEKNLD